MSSASSVDDIDGPPRKTGRFSFRSEEELDTLVENKDAPKTKDAIRFSRSVFTSFCEEIGTPLADVEKKTADDLCSFLRQFYAGLRQSNGQLYSCKSMATIRYGLQRHFKKEIDIDIIHNESFGPANEVFSAMLVKLKAEGKGSVQHKEPITKEDMLKIVSSSALDISKPNGLQNKVFVDIMIYLCNRGRENLRSMTKSHFSTQIDSTGLKYVSFNIDMPTKNHRGSIDDNEINQAGRIYATPESPLCPVKSFK